MFGFKALVDLSWNAPATKPICDDPGATDDRESLEGHLKSREVTIHFSPITRDRIEIETRNRVVPNDSARQFSSKDIHIHLVGS